MARSAWTLLAVLLGLVVLWAYSVAIKRYRTFDGRDGRSGGRSRGESGHEE